MVIRMVILYGYGVLKGPQCAFIEGAISREKKGDGRSGCKAGLGGIRVESIAVCF
jgi:hypothetical protein